MLFNGRIDTDKSSNFRNAFLGVTVYFRAGKSNDSPAMLTQIPIASGIVSALLTALVEVMSVEFNGNPRRNVSKIDSIWTYADLSIQVQMGRCLAELRFDRRLAL